MHNVWRCDRNAPRPPEEETNNGYSRRRFDRDSRKAGSLLAMLPPALPTTDRTERRILDHGHEGRKTCAMRAYIGKNCEERDTKHGEPPQQTTQAVVTKSCKEQPNPPERTASSMPQVCICYLLLPGGYFLLLFMFLICWCFSRRNR